MKWVAAAIVLFVGVPLVLARRMRALNRELGYPPDDGGWDLAPDEVDVFDQAPFGDDFPLPTWFEDEDSAA